MENGMYQKSYEIREKLYDVIVIGGGTAGSAAAIASAMEGAYTLIVERNSYLGGSASGGQVTPMMQNGIKGRIGRSYINEVILKKMAEEGYSADDSHGNDGWFNTEMLKFTLEEIFTDYNGEILYNTELIDTVVEDGKIKGILIHNKSGLLLIRGKIFIDCTGDAVAAYDAGVPCVTGEEISHSNQAMSLRFMVGNIKIGKLKSFLKEIGEPDILEYPFVEIAALWEWDTPFSSIFKQGVKDQVIKSDDCKYIQAFSVPGMPGVMSFNCPEIPKIKDALDPVSISKAVIIGRKMIKRLYRFLKIYLPGFEESFLMSVAEMPGIRESRRIKGKYVLSEEDYACRAKFDDAIARTAYPIDIHGHMDEKKKEIAPMKKGEYFEIPYRCLVTDNIDNLLVAGRCISSTFTAQSSIRIQPTCRAMGEAAGIAASYCVRSGIKANELDGGIVKDRMMERVIK
ncbi:MAG: FAD-dependent oxidoreductase [Lachnospiraceae bacterium]|nr:FAD-dependent oxidoreductase [Lachnospiraceae bacterium]